MVHEGSGLTSCQRKARKNGVLISICPPNNTIELGGVNAPADYYLFAFAEQNPYKATYDMLIDIG